MCSVDSVRLTSTSSSTPPSATPTRSPIDASLSSPSGLSRLVTARAASRTSFRCFSEIFDAAEISSSVGGLPSLAISSRSARPIFCSRSAMWTGMRIVRDLFATPRCTACRIHHVA